MTYPDEVNVTYKVKKSTSENNVAVFSMVYKQAIFFENDKQYAEAVKLYNILIANKEYAKYYITFGVCLQKLKHWEQSYKMVEKGLN